MKEKKVKINFLMTPDKIRKLIKEDQIKEYTLHTQILHFDTGYKRTIKEVICVWENEMVHILTVKGVEWVINKKRILCAEKIY